jgi:serine/threonine protein kinase
MSKRYDIVDKLGEGGAGTVIKAWDNRLQRHVAIKRLLPPEKREADFVGGDLAKEAAALSALQHPNIVSVYDLDEMDGEPCVIMEFINGETLEQTMERGALTVADFYEVARQSLEGLAAAHKLGVQHRDIKPSNIMVNWLPNGGFLVKMLDFGLADLAGRPRDAASKEGAGSAYGSVHFMAPEQLQGRPADARTDLYALGCVLYYALTAGYPFRGSNVDEVVDAHLKHRLAADQPGRKDVPKALWDWVLWLMGRKPEERPASAEAALETLRQIQSGSMKALPGAAVPAPSPRTVIPMSAPPVHAPAVKPAPPSGRVPRSPSAAGVGAPQGVDRKSEGRGKLALVIAASVVGACLAVWGAIVLLSKKKSPPPAASATDSPPAGKNSSGDAPTDLPRQELGLWLDAARGVKTAKGAKAATRDDPVDLWEDQAGNNGANPASYLHTKTAEASRIDKLPRLAEAGPGEGSGLGATFPVLHFAGRQNILLATREQEKEFNTVPNNLGVYDAAQQAFLVVFRTTGEGRQDLLAWNLGKEQDAWLVSVESGQVRAGPAASGSPSASLAIEAKSGFHILTLQIDKNAGTMALRLTDSRGASSGPAVAQNVRSPGGVERLRLGGSSKGSSQFGLKGDVAAVVWYSRLLPEKDLRLAEGFFAKKYFSK